MIKFNSFKEKAVLKNPLNNFAEETQTIEYRQDPLLGTWSRINIDRAKRVHQSSTADTPPQELKTSCENCFFCKNNVESKTPEFPAKLGIGARLKAGDAIIFPNLYPFAKYHAVCVLSENHGARLDELTPKNFEDALFASIKYVGAVYKTDSNARFASINMNYMPPAAASIIHPHLQITCDRKPSVYQEAAYEKAKAHYKKSKKNYFEELAKSDKARRIISKKNSAWLATFSPSLANDITGIFPKKASVLELSDADIRNIAKEISQILGALWNMGARSANMSIFSAPLGEKCKSSRLGSKLYNPKQLANGCKHFTLHARIGTRPEMKPNYSSDKGFMEVLHQETVVSTIPEDVAKEIRKRL